jgi:serine/threonine protein kinase
VQNVLLKDLSGDGQAVFIDFETSKDMSIQQTATMTQMHGGAVGTPAYMAPERIAGLPGTADTDRYSIGVVLLLAFCPDLIEDVEGGTLPPLDALDKVHLPAEELTRFLVRRKACATALVLLP